MDNIQAQGHKLRSTEFRELIRRQQRIEHGRWTIKHTNMSWNDSPLVKKSNNSRESNLRPLHQYATTLPLSQTLFLHVWEGF